MKPPSDPVRPFLWAIAVFAVLHHVDHVLRADNRGWPFQPEVTPFTWFKPGAPALVPPNTTRASRTCWAWHRPLWGSSPSSFWCCSAQHWSQSWRLPPPALAGNRFDRSSRLLEVD